MSGFLGLKSIRGLKLSHILTGAISHSPSRNSAHSSCAAPREQDTIRVIRGRRKEEFILNGLCLA